MNRESRVCPLCKSTMMFRLEEYECTACSYRGPVDLPTAPDLSNRVEEVEPRKHRLIIPPSSPVAEDSGPVFSPQDLDTSARVRFKDSGVPSAYRIQKMVVMCLMLLMGVFSMLMSMPLHESYAFEYGQSTVFTMFFGLAVSILIWGWGLFYPNLIVKYIFLVISGLNVLSLVASLIILIYASYSNVVELPVTLIPYMGVFLYIMLLGALWVYSWIFFLLYSDINALSN